MLRAALLLAALVLSDSVIPDWDGIAPPDRPTRLLDHGGAIFLGTDSGLYRRGADDPRGWSLVLASQPILDLAGNASEVFVATEQGLYVWSDALASAERVPLAAGDAARGLAVDDSGAVWVATDAGLFERAPAAREFVREPSLPAGEVAAVASAGSEVWVGVEGALYCGGHGRGFSRRLSGLDAGWWELRGAAKSAGVTLLGVASGVWRLDGERWRQIELGGGEVFRIAAAGPRLFVASERGLYGYPIAELGSGAGKQSLSVEALGLAIDGGRVWVATDRGLASFALDSGAPAAVATPPLDREQHAARIAALQHAVLAYQQLEPERTAGIESRARWKGLYPELRASAGFDRDGEWDGEHNTTFTSGAFHNLTDLDRNHHHGYDAAVTMVWELSDFVSPEDPLEVSRERRLVVSLRDQVLERVNHLYFQRLRVLGQLGALASDDQKRAELELTAAEIAAQLDAWSGGMFSRLEHGSPLELQREP
ncbi:MAG TPA: hypothetical protein VMR50_21835 [Myxococcota bacterium]|nr:hypothetical protein [Myxococcota bacterium]